MQDALLEGLVYIVLEVLMITKLGWTPGKLLLGICIKDANTLKNVSFTQVVTRSTFRELLWIPSYISEWFLILPMLVLIPAISDQRKQIFYDKIVKTLVIDYKPEECNSNVNYVYVGITRRAIAYIIDHFIIIKISLIFFSLTKMSFDSATSKLLIICSLLLLSMMFGIFMIRRFSCTPGQWLCYICIKDANTLKNITTTQAAIRYVLFEIINLSSILMVRSITGEYVTEWWCEFLPYLSFRSIIITIISAIYDRRKQTFYDKIARTVVIDYKPSS